MLVGFFYPSASPLLRDANPPSTCNCSYNNVSQFSLSFTSYIHCTYVTQTTFVLLLIRLAPHTHMKSRGVGSDKPYNMPHAAMTHSNCKIRVTAHMQCTRVVRRSPDAPFPHPSSRRCQDPDCKVPELWDVADGCSAVQQDH